MRYLSNIQLRVDGQEDNGTNWPLFQMTLSNQTDYELTSDRTSGLTIFSNKSAVRVERRSIKFSQR